MTTQQFEAISHLARELLNLSADRMAVARLVVVDNMTNAQAASLHGVTAQSVWRTVDRLRDVEAAYEAAKVIESNKNRRVST